MNITWIYKGAKVKDRFGEWVIFACPDRVDERAGEIEITISASDGSQRDIWLTDFLRDFEPIQHGPFTFVFSDYQQMPGVMIDPQP